jgi:hypothetical protein
MTREDESQQGCFGSAADATTLVRPRIGSEAASERWCAVAGVDANGFLRSRLSLKWALFT